METVKREQLLVLGRKSDVLNLRFVLGINKKCDRFKLSSILKYVLRFRTPFMINVERWSSVSNVYSLHFIRYFLA